MINYFANPNNNYIYAGDKTSASPVREMSRPCTDAAAKYYDDIDKKIRALERQRKYYWLYSRIRKNYPC